MKKALLFGLSLSLALSLTACGGSNDNAADSTQDTSNPEVTQPVDTSTPEADPIVEEINAVTSEKTSDLELYELIYETAAIGLDVTDEVAFEMEKDLAEAYSGASASGEAFYDGYITWRLENHPLQTTDPAPDTTPSNGGTSSGNTSGGNTSGSSGGTNTTNPTTNTGNSGSNTGNSGGSTGNSGGSTGNSGGSTGNSGGSTGIVSGFDVTSPGEDSGGRYNPSEGMTEEEIAQQREENHQKEIESGVTFGTGSRSN